VKIDDDSNAEDNFKVIKRPRTNLKDMLNYIPND
jgi:hypothetical protein